jgi:hypothetical protein
MIHSFTVTFGLKYLTGMVISVPPYKSFSLIKKCSSKIQISEICHIGLGHVTLSHSFINMLLIPTGIFDDKLRSQILSVGTIANATIKDSQTCIKRSPFGHRKSGLIQM